MLVQTFRGCIGLGVLIALGASASWSQSVPSLQPSVSVAVWNDAGVRIQTVMRAEEIASGIFQRAGIDVTWLNCGMGGEAAPETAEACRTAAFPTQLQLRIVRRSRNLAPGIFGISYLADEIGCYSEVFVDPAKELRKNFPVSLASMLGHVAAHEVAHLLLGSNSHSATGMMRARWEGEDLVKAEKGALLFSKAEGEIMRGRLSAGAKRSEEGSQITSRLREGGAN